ncbi:Uncharacterised protein [Photobacterium damselae]|uniref:Uncharacterized protein n=1 Tax=Photobacterium damselae TaxID=38293 RepID=A0A2X1ZNR3_PHODM|nr:Uncharacterised protein [Photobacterium damselae]
MLFRKLSIVIMSGSLACIVISLFVIYSYKYTCHLHLDDSESSVLYSQSCSFQNGLSKKTLNPFSQLELSETIREAIIQDIEKIQSDLNDAKIDPLDLDAQERLGVIRNVKSF